MANVKDVGRSSAVRPRSGLPPPPPVPTAAPATGARPRRLRRLLVLVPLVALAVGVGIWSFQAGRASHRITRTQWASIPLGISKAQTIERLGKKPFRQQTTKDGAHIHYYAAGANSATFYFRKASGKLWLRTWLVAFDARNPIGLAAYRSIRTGMTQRQVQHLLGPPRMREDEVYRFYGTILSKFGQASRRCTFYTWAPNPDKMARFCFISNKLVDKAKPS
jgi:hypothetical protein